MMWGIISSISRGEHMVYLLIIILGGAGVITRYFITSFYVGSAFPVGTLLVNVFGSFFMGLYYGQQMDGPPWFPPPVNTAITVGFLGALTTYSTFSVETIRLIQQEAYGVAGLNILANTVLSLGGCFTGLKLIGIISSNVGG